MSLKQFILDTLCYFQRKKYKVEFNNHIFNQLAKDNVLFNNSGIVGIYEHFSENDSKYSTLMNIQKVCKNSW